MTRILIPALLWMTFINLAGATLAADFERLYEPRVFKSADGKTLPYRLMVPANYQADSTTRYPVVLFLHGAGERGDDNLKPLVHGTHEFAKDAVRDKFPCFVVVPQCPDSKRWVEVDWGQDSHQQFPEDSETIALVLQLMTSLQQQYRIDDKRLYATGLSMGGFGVWDMVTRYPDKFAAAVPVCAGADEAVAAKVTKLPIWTFHGDKDTVVKPSRTRNIVAAIEKAGGHPIYTEYAGVGHDSWDKAYAEPKLMEWLFAQRKP